jgi:hypothetical protein
MRVLALLCGVHDTTLRAWASIEWMEAMASRGKQRWCLPHLHGNNNNYWRGKLWWSERALDPFFAIACDDLADNGGSLLWELQLDPTSASFFSVLLVELSSSHPDLAVAFVWLFWIDSAAGATTHIGVSNCNDGVAGQCPVGRHHHSVRLCRSLIYPCLKLASFSSTRPHSDPHFRPRINPSQMIPVDICGTSLHLQNILHHGAPVRATGHRPTRRREPLFRR